MSSIRRKLMMQNTEETIDTQWMFDIHCEIPEMYDAVSGFRVMLGSYGIFNATYNCLQKKMYGGVRDTASLSLVNHPIKNFSSTLPNEKKFVEKYKFKASATSQLQNIVFWYVNGAYSHVGGFDNNRFLNYIPQYSLNRTYEFVKEVDNTCIRNWSILDENETVLWNHRQQANDNSYDVWMPKLLSNSTMWLLPGLYSQQQGDTFYLVSAKMYITKK